MSFDKKAYNKKWREKNPEYYKEYNEKWAAENSKYIKEYKHKWYLENAERTKAHKKVYYLENEEHIKKYRKKYRRENSEGIYEKTKKWRTENPEKFKSLNRISSRKHRALKNGAVGYHIESDLIYIYEKQKGKCISCGNKFSYEQMTVDHINPLSKGGSDFPINVQLLCGSCNSSKGNHHATDYREFETDLLRNKSSIRLIFE